MHRNSTSMETWDCLCWCPKKIGYQDGNGVIVVPNVLLSWHGQSERYRPGMGGYACGEPRKPSGKGGPERRRCFSLQVQGEKRPGAAFTGEG